MTLSADERALLTAVDASPDDPLPRLVYADWLEEHGRPKQAGVIRCDHWRMRDNFDPYFRILDRRPLLHTQLVYMPGATPGIIGQVHHGIVFMMAWWSGPAMQAFTNLADALQAADPTRSQLLVVIDVDGIGEDFSEQFRPRMIHLTGAGETLWLKYGRLVQMSVYGTPSKEWRRAVTDLQRDYDKPK